MPTKKKDGLNPKVILKDPICCEWISYCIAEDKVQTIEWYRQKREFWEENQEHLKKNGFHSYNGNLDHALDSLTMEKIEDMEGCLLLVKIGNDSRPAGPDDIELANRLIQEALDGVEGVRVLVTHHAINIEKISLPKLRQLQSEVLASRHQEGTKSSHIISDMEL